MGIEKLDMVLTAGGGDIVPPGGVVPAGGVVPPGDPVPLVSEKLEPPLPQPCKIVPTPATDMASIDFNISRRFLSGTEAS